MRLELAHDLLAKAVHEKASEDQKLKNKISKFVKRKFELYKESGMLLSKHDLAFIDPHVDNLNLSEKQKIFLNISKNRLRLKVAFTFLCISLVLILFVSFLLISNSSNLISIEKYKELQLDNSKLTTTLLKMEKTKDSLSLEVSKAKSMEIGGMRIQILKYKKNKGVLLKLKGKWFDMWYSGKKKEDYRELTNGWLSRLFGVSLIYENEEKAKPEDVYNWMKENSKEFLSKYQPKPFEHIQLDHAYASDRPQCKAKFISVEIREGKKKWNAKKEHIYFCVMGNNIYNCKNIKTN